MPKNICTHFKHMLKHRELYHFWDLGGKVLHTNRTEHVIKCTETSRADVSLGMVGLIKRNLVRAQVRCKERREDTFLVKKMFHVLMHW